MFNYLILTLILFLGPIELPNHLNYDTIAAKIQPTPTYALFKYDHSGFKKGDKVKILEDVKQGSIYCIQKDTIITWVNHYVLEILPPTSPSPPSLTSSELEYYANTKDFTSITPYYLWVDLWRQKLYVFYAKHNDWLLVKEIPCATGKPTTPTVRGTFTLLERGEALHSSERVHYWIKFYKNYLFHSLPLGPQNEVIDHRLGEPISNGCIRLLEEDAKWLYETIPNETTVWIY